MLGVEFHYAVDILVYGTVGPVLAFLLLNVLGRWLDERETSELQAAILAQARERARRTQQLNDDTVQALFAASLLLHSAQSGLPEAPPDVSAQLRAADQSLDKAIHRLREHLLSHSAPLTPTESQ